MDNPNNKGDQVRELLLQEALQKIISLCHLQNGKTYQDIEQCLRSFTAQIGATYRLDLIAMFVKTSMDN